jgi:hypothetical protein
MSHARSDGLCAVGTRIADFVGPSFTGSMRLRDKDRAIPALLEEYDGSRD